MIRNLIALICVVAVLQVDAAATGKKSSSGKGGITGQIVGGTTSTRGQFPYIALVKTNPGNSIYGGSLIHGQWVLTSASCASRSTNFYVTLGVLTYNLMFEDGRVTLETNVKFINPQYNASIPINDIALLKLPYVVPSTSAFIKVVRLPKKSEATATFLNQLGTASGWGVVNETVSTSLTPALRNVVMPVISNTSCAIWGAARVISTTLCSNTSGYKQPCAGDQGGPYVYNEADGVGTQIGVISFYNNPCSTDSRGIPAVFAKVSAFLTWIESTATGIVIRA